MKWLDYGLWARLGLLHLGCNKEVGGLLRWLLPQVSLEGVWRERQQL